MIERLQSSWIASEVNQMSLQERTNWRRNWSRWRRSNAYFTKRKAMKQIIKTMLKLRMTWSYLTWTKLYSYPHSRTWDMGTRWSCPTEHARSPWMNQTCHRGAQIVQKDRKGNRRRRREMQKQVSMGNQRKSCEVEGLSLQKEVWGTSLLEIIGNIYST